jgi:all-trans-retinol dehydrogenase (NAD+)
MSISAFITHSSDIIKAFGAIFVLIYFSIFNSIRFLIPYKYRSKDISGELALVTGAGSGIGKSLSKKLAKIGCTVICWDIDEKANEQTVNEIKQSGGKAHSFKCDLSKRENVYEVAERVKQEVGNPSILINNAGIVTGRKFLDCNDQAIEKTMQVNSVAHFWTTKAFLPYMLDRNHGHIVSVASMAGLFGVSGLCDYSASKFAAVGFNESLSKCFNNN